MESMIRSISLGHFYFFFMSLPLKSENEIGHSTGESKLVQIFFFVRTLFAVGLSVLKFVVLCVSKDNYIIKFESSFGQPKSTIGALHLRLSWTLEECPKKERDDFSLCLS